MQPLPSASFLVDENLPESLVQDLQAVGYSAEHVFAVGLRVPDTLPPAKRNHYVIDGLKTLQGQSLQDTLVIIEIGRVRVRR